MKISTMTYIAQFESELDTNGIYNKYLKSKINDDLYVEDKSKKFNRKGKPQKSFGNQITIKSKTKRYNIKLFYNKKMQLTGIKSVDDLLGIFRQLEHSLKFNISAPKLVMKNMVTDLSKEIKLYDLYDLMQSKGLDVNYSPEIYPGLKLKFNGLTAMVFATGKMIISTKSIEEPYELESLVLECVNDLQNFQRESQAR